MYCFSDMAAMMSHENTLEIGVTCFDVNLGHESVGQVQ